MKTKAQIKSHGQKLVDSAKEISWKDVDRLRNITRNIFYIQQSLILLDKHPNKSDLLDLKSNADDKTIKCIEYILS